MPSNHPLQRPPRFEAHITVPRMPSRKLKPFLDRLHQLDFRVGIDYFRQVINVDRDPRLRSMVDARGARFSCSTPTGHDLHIPGAMITLKAEDRARILFRVRVILGLVEQLLPQGGFNFEIEAILSPNRGTSDIPIHHFSRYRAVQDAPVSETHIGWHGDSLPSNPWVVSRLIQQIGIAPHQIVAFSEHRPGGRFTDRVVTFYQSSPGAALELAATLRRLRTSLGAAYVIAEQVCVVGELRPLLDVFADRGP